MNDTVKIFVTYSHRDAEYLDDDSLLGFLKGLEKDGVEFWTDRRIRPGELWDAVIKANLQEADIALVLVSQAFLDSAYCQNVEIEHCLCGPRWTIRPRPTNSAPSSACAYPCWVIPVPAWGCARTDCRTSSGVRCRAAR